MSLLDDITAAIGPVVSDLAPDLGCRLTVYRVVNTEASNGQIVRTYPTPAAQLTNVAAFLVPNTSDTSNVVGAPQAVRPTGTTDDQGMRLYIPAHNGALPVLNAFDGVKITTGAYAGYTFICTTDSAPDVVGLMAGVSVIAAPAGAIT